MENMEILRKGNYTMAKADILFDKTEFVLRVADKQAMSMDIRADQITTITFKPTYQKKMFKKIDSEVMLLQLKGGAGGPGGGTDGIPVTKEAMENKEKGSWDKAKAQMIKFAKANSITLHEETDYWEPPKENMQ